MASSLIIFIKVKKVYIRWVIKFIFRYLLYMGIYRILDDFFNRLFIVALFVVAEEWEYFNKMFLVGFWVNKCCGGLLDSY